MPAARYFVSAAVINASEKIIAKGKRIAAHLLESGGRRHRIWRTGPLPSPEPTKRSRFEEVAKTAFQKPKLPADIEPGLYEHGEFGMGQGQMPTYPNGVHLAEIEIDTETGKVELVRYTAGR